MQQSVVKASSSETAVALTGVTDPHKVYLKRAPSPEILDEDSYIDTVSDIIERDFFPGLKRLKLQNDFLDAVQSADLAKAKALGIELHRMATGAPGRERASSSEAPGSNTPSRVETPIVTGFTPYSEANASATPVSQTPKSTEIRNPPAPEPASNTNTKEKALDSSLSLDAFQSRYTSEDNASFSVILKKQNEDRKERYHWYFEKESGRLRLGNGGETDGGEKPIGLLEGKGSLETKSVATWKFKAKNDLMYPIDGAPETLGDLKELRGPPKSISHASTRFAPTHTTKDVLQASRDAAERLQTQEVWREMAKATPALFPDAGSETPASSKVNGFSLVPNTPSLEPHRDIDPSDLMTWGMIDGTPLLLDSGRDHSGGGPAFSIAPTPKREQILDKLAEEASKSLRKRATGKTSFIKPMTPLRPGTSRTPIAGASRSDLTPKRNASTPLIRAGTPLSKAAQDLLSKSSRPGSSSLLAMAAARGFGGDAQLRASYSHTPTGLGVRRPSSVSRTPKATPGHAMGARGPTPVQAGRGGKASDAAGEMGRSLAKQVPTTEELLEKSKQGSLITDDLLNF
ncbi:Envelope glycoprotein [Dinochytrium kinnereticum]|nr:Envelope glycoprotein [Dinochytrium kinnereticum]